MAESARIHRRRWLGVTAGLVGVAVLVGCGGGSGSPAGSSGSGSTRNALKRLEVEVARGSARAPAPSLVARAADLLGWPQLAEASHCTVSAGGVTETTGPDERAVLRDVALDTNGSVLVQVTCSDGTVGQFTLAGGPPGTVVVVRVDVRPDRVEVRVRDQHVSGVSPPSPPSRSESRSGRS
jgi:hypothetical protein